MLPRPTRQSSPTSVPAPAAATARRSEAVAEPWSYRAKRAALGRPLVTASLHEEKLSKKSALGVLSSDCISSAAYGSEEMLIVLLAVFGLTGFHLLMPMTLAVIIVLTIMTLSYREVVSIYTKAGGSYVVARENFGPKVAQIASVALMIDYIVTVAVQAAAGTAAITSLAPALNSGDIPIAMTIGVVLLLAYGNLRGVREAGKAFALPTYFFVVSAGLVVVVGIGREIFGDLPKYGHGPGMIPIVNEHHSILSGVAIFYLLKAFANGGASLTGLEAISNGVSAFRRPEGRNARRTLTVMSVLLGTLVLGVSYLSYETHATPYSSGSPTVISQVAKAAFGPSWYGHLGFVMVQVATALILYTGANTPFTGFPFLASFIAEDSFLPRQMTRRGHRLAFSNGIIVLTVAALALLLGVGAHVDKLIPFYAIGVFTGFTMAGFGMARYHHTHREAGWRHKLVINATGGAMSALVVLIFAVVKFTEGAWLVVVLFPIGWAVLMRLNQRYRDESRSLELVTAVVGKKAASDGSAGSVAAPMHYARHVVIVFVDRLDLAVLRAIRYAGSLHPSDVRAVHLMIDNVESERLQQSWIEHGLSDRVPLAVVECPDRRLPRTAADVALSAVLLDDAEVTALLPRRTFRRISQRLLHDRTADRLAATLSRIPHVSATIVPFDTTLDADAESRLEARQQHAAAQPALPATSSERADSPADEAARANLNEATAQGPDADGVYAIGSLAWKQRVTVEGRVSLVQASTLAGRSFEAQLFDDTGGLRLLFYGRTRIPGIEPGVRLRASGTVGKYKGHLAIANPVYTLVAVQPS